MMKKLWGVLFMGAMLGPSSVLFGAALLAPSGCAHECTDCPSPSGWSVVEWAGSCCYRASPCMTEQAEEQLYSACKAQDPEHPFPVLCGGETMPEGCVELAGQPAAECGDAGSFGVVCCSSVVP